MLTVIEQVLSREEIRSFQSRLQQAAWRDGAGSAGTLARQVKANEQLAADDPLAIELGDILLRALSGNALFISAALPSRIYPPRFNRYRGGGSYGAHIDGALMQLPTPGPGEAGTHAAGQWLRSDLAATLFLADPDAYQGGELEIEGGFGIQEIKLAAGDMVLYPASSLHRVAPVTDGSRLASFFWIQSLVRDDGERALLHDLDCSIQELAPTVPARDPRLLKLTGVYHNLLRRWATT